MFGGRTECDLMDDVMVRCGIRTSVKAKDAKDMLFTKRSLWKFGSYVKRQFKFEGIPATFLRLKSFFQDSLCDLMIVFESYKKLQLLGGFSLDGEDVFVEFS